MSVELQEVTPDDTFVGGAAKFSANDGALVDALNALGAYFTGEDPIDHGERYYTKAEIDSLIGISSEEYYLILAYKPGGVYFGPVPVETTGIPVINASTIVGMSILAADGTKTIATFSSGNALADGDKLNIYCETLDSPGNGYKYDIGFYVQKNGADLLLVHFYVNTWAQNCAVLFTLRKT